MDKKISLQFSVENFEFEDVKDSRFIKGVIHAFADGKNAHTHPIDRDVLINCANSVYDIPVVCRYNGLTDDFMSHEPDETPIGFVKETSPTYSNPIIFEKNPDGRTFLVIKALIWKKYAKDAVRVFKNDNGRKSVSVEITITKGEEINGLVRVDEFVLDGITVLGDFVTPAVKDAHIQVEFAKDKNEYLNNLKFAENEGEKGEQDMENEKDMAENSVVSCSSCDTSNMSDSATCASSCEGMACDSAEMSSSVNCESNQSEDMATTDCAENCAEDFGCKSNMEDTGEGRGDTRRNREDGNDTDDRDDSRDDDINDEDDRSENYACKNSESMSIEMAMNKISEMSDKIKELEAQNRAYMSKIESMSDYENLRQYRDENEKRVKMEADMATMNTVMSEIVSRGYSMSDDEKNNFISKFSEFNSADAWSNYVKAQVFDNCNNSSKVQQIGLPFAELKKTNSIWDSI